MKVLITGICGFAGGAVALELQRLIEGLEIIGFDNLSRPGSERNRHALQAKGIRFLHGDLRNPSDLENLPKVDWVIDAAANPSVLAGVTGVASSRQLMEHNLVGTLHLLECCKRQGAGLVMLSTSRVYSLEPLCELPLDVKDSAFMPRWKSAKQSGLTKGGVSEDFPIQPPLSLYGTAKLASELLILEYHLAFNFPVHINRCGVLAGPGQFGKPDQGIFSFWIHSWRAKRPLKYIGFGGTGHQTRDCLHPRDLAALVAKQLKYPERGGKVLNVSGGMDNSMSLAQLSRWCARRFGKAKVDAQPENRTFDVPWLVLDSSRVKKEWGWIPATGIETTLEEIACHADEHPDWLAISNAA